jgi:DNA-directed RNA polymerase sigma subunit (sigma70/sigma32)
MTLERIGALMGVTRERIRQIRERAFDKLRESPDGTHAVTAIRRSPSWPRNTRATDS